MFLRRAATLRAPALRRLAARRPLSATPPGRVEVAVARGDGVGPEIMDATVRVLEATGAPLDFKSVGLGLEAYERGCATGMTDDARETIERCGVLLKAPLATPVGRGYKSVNVTARKLWGVFANKRRARTVPGVEAPVTGHVDITTIRENIECTYGGIEHAVTHDVAQCRRLITRKGTEQVVRYAFEMARERAASKRSEGYVPRLTCVHKANIMKLTCGMFLDVFNGMKAEYPEVKADSIIVDALCMGLVTDPSKFDILVCSNLQGDIVSDLCAGLVGGLGFAPSANIGNSVSIFEAVHGTAPDIAGKNLANPTALMMSASTMLRHVGLPEHAMALDSALGATLTGGLHTHDVRSTALSSGKGALGTREFADAVVSRITPVPEGSAAPPTFVPRPVPAQNAMLATPDAERPAERVVGADVFVQSTEQPDQVAERMQRLVAAFCAAKPGRPVLKLIMVSNRGTQVWPNGSTLTELVDHYRCRLEVDDPAAPGGDAGDAAVMLEAAQAVAAEFTVVSTETLFSRDGKRGYSLAQGQ